MRRVASLNKSVKGRKNVDVLKSKKSDTIKKGLICAYRIARNFCGVKFSRKFIRLRLAVLFLQIPIGIINVFTD